MRTYRGVTDTQKFKQADDLRRHQVKHTGGKSFTYETCLKKFSQDVEIRRHQGKTISLVKLVLRNSVDLIV